MASRSPSNHGGARRPLAFALDIEGRIQRISDPDAGILGRAPSDLVGEEFSSLLPDEERPRLRRFLAELLEDRPEGRLTLWVTDGEGQAIPAVLHARTLHANGGPRGFEARLEELPAAQAPAEPAPVEPAAQAPAAPAPATEPSAGSETEHAATRALIVLSELTAALGETQSTEGVFQTGLESALTLTRATDGAAYELREERAARCRARAGDSASAGNLFPADLEFGKDDEVLLPASWLGYPRLLSNGNPITRPLLFAELARQGRAGALLVPLLHRGQARGFLTLAAPASLGGLDPAQRAALDQVGALVGARLADSQLERQIRDLGARFKDLTETSADHIWETDAQCRYTWNSPSLRFILGYDPGDLSGRTPADFAHPDDREDLRERLASALKDRQPLQGRVHRVIGSDGMAVHVESRAFPIFDEEGGLVGLRGMDRNITDWFEAKRILEDTLTGTCEALSRMVELRDPYTKGHSTRVAHLAVIIGRSLGRSEYELQGLHLMGLLHDIGKVGIPTEILSKPDRLTTEELALVRQHPTMGYDILKDISFPWPVAAAVLQHHERLDGSGYPQGLEGAEIMWQVRLLGVADLLEAMATHRPYRPGLGWERALQELTLNKGLLYDPEIVDAVLRMDAEGALRGSLDHVGDAAGDDDADGPFFDLEAGRLADPDQKSEADLLI
ncbi:MAG: PAS domain S-box protein [Candidatus Krumholzibacteriota bacterium]|nr:PAS domain S-box protein [Candidatus Krumholzibacteriota bacterium]